MRLYVAAGFSGQEFLRSSLPVFEQSGIEVTSNWLYEPVIKHDDPQDEHRWLRGLANEDMLDIRRAHGLAMFAYWPSKTGGRYVEFGVALSQMFEQRDFNIYLVGPQRENLFQHLSGVRHIDAETPWWGVRRLVTAVAEDWGRA